MYRPHQVEPGSRAEVAFSLQRIACSIPESRRFVTSVLPGQGTSVGWSSTRHAGPGHPDHCASIRRDLQVLRRTSGPDLAGDRLVRRFGALDLGERRRARRADRSRTVHGRRRAAMAAATARSSRKQCAGPSPKSTTRYSGRGPVTYDSSRRELARRPRCGSRERVHRSRSPAATSGDAAQPTILPFSRPETEPSPVTSRVSGGCCTVVVFDFSWLPSGSVRTKSDRTTYVVNRLRSHAARNERAAAHRSRRCRRDR